MFVMEGRAADTHELLANTGQSAGEALFTVRMAPGNCTAMSYLGAIAADSSRWAVAAAESSRAATCHEEAREASRKERAEAEQGRDGTSAVAQDITRRIIESDRQAARAWLNAAGAGLRAGDRDAAVAHAKRAAANEEFKGQAEALLRPAR
ncbi:MAG: hypothetical protein AB7P99_21700 [Vicinamibacterales bacterium]